MNWLTKLVPVKHFCQTEVTELDDLAAIHRSNVNFVYCKRPVDDDIDLFARYLISKDFKDINEVVNSENLSGVVNRRLESSDFPSVGKGKLAHDVVQIALSFFQITQASHLRLILKVVADDACRKFHTDAYDLRLLCTYTGKGTEWVSDRYVNRRKLFSGSNEEIIRDFSKVRSTDPFEVAILKGEIDSQPERKGIVHRSPPIQQQAGKRLLLRLDF